MKRLNILLTGLLIISSLVAVAQDKGGGMLLQKGFDDLPGKEGVMLTVEYPPGASSPKHRHNAHTFVYVLEGTLMMQVEGGELMTLKPGDTFYETPDDIHTVSKNASNSEPAKAVVFFVKKQGAPITEPVP